MNPFFYKLYMYIQMYVWREKTNVRYSETLHHTDEEKIQNKRHSSETLFFLNALHNKPSSNFNINITN